MSALKMVDSVVPAADVSPEGAVLVVEDNLDDMFFLKRAWEKAEWKAPLTHARDGKEAKDILLGALSSKSKLPQLVMTDLAMPVLSGFELIKFMKSTPALSRLTVLVWSSSNQLEDLRLAYDLGAHCFLPKPMTLDGWQFLVQRLKDFYDWQEPR